MYGRRRKRRRTTTTAKAQDTRASPNSLETHRVRRWEDIGHLGTLSPWSNGWMDGSFITSHYITNTYNTIEIKFITRARSHLNVNLKRWNVNLKRWNVNLKRWSVNLRRDTHTYKHILRHIHPRMHIQANIFTHARLSTSGLRRQFGEIKRPTYLNL